MLTKPSQPIFVYEVLYVEQLEVEGKTYESEDVPSHTLLAIDAENAITQIKGWLMGQERKVQMTLGESPKAKSCNPEALVSHTAVITGVRIVSAEAISPVDLLDAVPAVPPVLPS